MAEQYKSLNDAAKRGGAFDALAPGDTEVWYAKNPTFMVPEDPLPIETTHVLLGKVVSIDRAMLFHLLQGEMWSPNGEARTLVLSLGLLHTSMSIGDAFRIEGVTYIADIVSFRSILPKE